MRQLMAAFAVAILLVALANPAEASPKNSMVERTTAQGCHILVHPAEADKFVKFFELLKDHGHRVNCNIVGCWSNGHKPGSNHSWGGACDIQTSWNRGPRFVYHMHSLVREAGLFDGCDFGDCGHVEAKKGLHNRPPAFYAATASFKAGIAE